MPAASWANVALSVASQQAAASRPNRSGDFERGIAAPSPEKRNRLFDVRRYWRRQRRALSFTGAGIFSESLVLAGAFLLALLFDLARYDIVTAVENWVAVVAGSGSFDRPGHAPTLCGPTMFARIGFMSRAGRRCSRP